MKDVENNESWDPKSGGKVGLSGYEMVGWVQLD